MNRRHFLFSLVCAPVIAPVVVKALSVPKPEYDINAIEARMMARGELPDRRPIGTGIFCGREQADEIRRSLETYYEKRYGIRRAVTFP